MCWSSFAAAMLVTSAFGVAPPSLGATDFGAASGETPGPDFRSATITRAGSRKAAPEAGERSRKGRTQDRGEATRRAGVPDVTPPQIDSLIPSPGTWIVDNFALREVQIGFTEAVIVPVGAISVRTVGGGPVSGFTTSYDSLTDTLTVAFDSPIRDDRLTLVVDYSVTDLAGNELDGEISVPDNAFLPSGDGVLGGQAVFRINVLQGDANRDGAVDAADAGIILSALGRCNGEAGYDVQADLNLDACVNIFDVSLFELAAGRQLPVLDGTPPFVAAVPVPGPQFHGVVDSVVVDFSEIVSSPTINPRTCFLVNSSGDIFVPTSAAQSGSPESIVYTFNPALPQCDTYSINLSNALGDLSGELLVAPSTPPASTGLVPPLAPLLDPHPTMTTDPTVTITGSAPGASDVEVSAPTGLLVVPTVGDTFTAVVPLTLDSGNDIYVVAVSNCAGVRSPPILTTVTHDGQPPSLFIDLPVDNSEITTATTDVAGRVGDILSGFLGLDVQLVINGDTANPITAVVDVGIGNNGTFFAPNVSLAAIDQPTVIAVTATDQLGNAITKQVTVTQVEIPPDTPQMVVVSGAAQTGQIGSVLALPIVIRMTHGDGVTPFVNKVVTFDVTRSNGRLGDSAAEVTPTPGNPDPGSMTFQAHTDGLGEASAFWRLGFDAGCGNNRVEVASTSIAGTVVFCASGTPAPVNQINIGSGNNQVAEAGSPAPAPLRVWVNDACNGIPNQQISFSVVSGGGKVNGLDSVTVLTLDTGHAEVSFTLGPNAGNNVVDASVLSNPTLPAARFVTYGLVRDEALPTTFSGVVLNNANQPIQGAVCRLSVGGTFMPDTTTDIDGEFVFGAVTGSGTADLLVDGSAADHVGGASCVTPECDILPGSFPSLHFEPVIVPNAPNALPTPIRLPTLNPANVRAYSTTQETLLTVEGMEGLEMRVAAGSMSILIDNQYQPAPDGTPIFLNQVQDDDIPMPIPDGASPPFAWTLQPSGARFDPPVQITYPNMSGLPAGSIAYFLSFNHDTSRFDIVATGQVSNDGASIVTDPGTGLSVSGWGCNCPPYSVTEDCCSGCDSDCCDGSCCGGSCCEGSCCGGECCDGSCCGGECCDGECCGGECCADCCGGECCEGECCEGQCCGDGESCCNGVCCAGLCCEGQCCAASDKSCCDGMCCEGLCCEGTCCAAADKSCCDGLCCAGPCCDATGECCAAGDESCCNNECCEGPCCNGNCCEAGANCCGLDCCPPDTTCCDGTGELCCPTGLECCDTKCCPEGWSCCDGACCPGPCCEGVCCAGTDVSCCNGACCDGECCNGVCCTGGGLCCNGVCCAAGTESCCQGTCCDGPCCGGNCCPADNDCCGVSGCCPEGDLCCAATGGGCCPQSPVAQACCGEGCCPVGRACCEETGECCPEGKACCGGDTCCDPDKCCDGMCCTANETCCATASANGRGAANEVCVPASCSFSVGPEEGCAGTIVQLTVTGDCEPDCDTMDFSLNKSVQYLTVNPPSPMPCIGSPHVDTFTVEIAPDAPEGPIVFAMTGTTENAECSTLVTVTVRNPELTITSLLPPGTFVLGTDLVINYEVTPPTGTGFDQVDLEIKNASGVLVFASQGLPGSPGAHSVTWPDGKWNQAPFAGTFANPKNSPYEIKLTGISTLCPDRTATSSVSTKLELEADIKDDLPAGSTAMRSAGLEDMLDTLKIVMKLGASETVFSGSGAITVTGSNPDDKHIKVDAAGLNTLADGLYDVLFRDLRDEIGNFADDDGVQSNGIQPIKFSLELR